MQKKYEQNGENVPPLQNDSCSQHQIISCRGADNFQTRQQTAAESSGKRQQEENKIEKFDETAFSGQTEIFSRRNAGQRERSVLVESVNKKDCRDQQQGNNAI